MKKTGYVGLMQAAEAAWPEDEANGTFCTLKERLIDDGDDSEARADDVVCFVKDVAHMRKVFGREADAEALIVRYDAELARLLKSEPITAHLSVPPSPFPAPPLA